MSILIPIAATILALVITAIIWIGNKGSFHNFMEPSADWILVALAVGVAVAWILYGVLR